MDRKLINYLPEVLRNYREFQKTFEAEEPEFENLQDELSKVLNDLFVEDATERGVKRWENILGIVSKPSENLEDRKFKILSKLVKKLPYTYRRLEQLLGALCGEDGYLLEIVEGTENLVTNPTEWMVEASPSHQVVEDAGRYLGCKISKTTKITSSTPASQLCAISIADGETYTASIFNKCLHNAGEDYAGRLIFYNFATSQTLARVETEKIGEWERLKITYTNNTGATLNNVRVLYYPARIQGSITLTAAPQVEKKPYATPFVDGIRLYNYTVKVRVALARKNMFNDVKILLQEIIPANHIVDLSLLYNQHFTVGQYKHGELSTWTHDYIRNEVLNQ